MAPKDKLKAFFGMSPDSKTGSKSSREVPQPLSLASISLTLATWILTIMIDPNLALARTRAERDRQKQTAGLWRRGWVCQGIHTTVGHCHRFNPRRRSRLVSKECSSPECSHRAVQFAPNDPGFQRSIFCQDCTDVVLVPPAKKDLIKYVVEPSFGFMGWYCLSCDHVNMDDRCDKTPWPKDCSTCRQVLGNHKMKKGEKLPWSRDENMIRYVLLVAEPSAS